jgi:prepilin-type N-terminal cleavage/methylation domain-containing protein
MFNLKLKKTRKTGIARDQSGFTLIEAVIGIALLGIVAVAVLMGISTAFKASATADKISTTLALAQSQLDYIQTQEYICVTGGNAVYLRIDDASRGANAQSLGNYTIKSVNYDGSDNAGPSVTAVTIDAGGADVGLQKITLKVYQANNTDPVTLVAYKVKPTTEICP